MMSTMNIKELLRKKYGNYIINTLIDNQNRILLDKSDSSSVNGQNEVISHLKKLTDKEGEILIPKKYFRPGVDWGIDCSGWIGPIDINNSKSVMIIGAEPNVMKNFKIAYDFGSKSNISLEDIAMFHYNTPFSANTRDLWNIITKIFVNNLSKENITVFLSKCYICDLCFFAPKNTGQVSNTGKKKGIIELLEITKSEWTNFKFKVAENFLLDEVLTVNPKMILLSGSSPRTFFQRKLKVKFDRIPIKVEGCRLSIYHSKWNNIKLIGIPHFSGSTRGELWKCDEFPNRKIEAKQIINQII